MLTTIKHSRCSDIAFALEGRMVLDKWRDALTSGRNRPKQEAWARITSEARGRKQWETVFSGKGIGMLQHCGESVPEPSTSDLYSQNHTKILDLSNSTLLNLYNLETFQEPSWQL